VKKILAVDDNESILEVLNEILQQEGYEVVTLSTGKEVLRTVEKIHPDLILMDVMLDDQMDGRDICSVIKQDDDTQRIPVILISATHNPEDTMDHTGGADDFIAKPFDISFLLEKIGKQLAA
jgi:CheY-like chemotaxis protein